MTSRTTGPRRVTQEEVFGPVLSVYPFDDEADGVQAANGTPYGLTATVWTSSIRHSEAMIDGLECGKISVNSPGFPYPGLPEGGKKAAGYGRDLGPESLDGYLHSKSVILVNASVSSAWGSLNASPQKALVRLDGLSRISIHPGWRRN